MSLDLYQNETKELIARMQPIQNPPERPFSERLFDEPSDLAWLLLVVLAAGMAMILIRKKDDRERIVVLIWSAIGAVTSLILGFTLERGHSLSYWITNNFMRGPVWWPIVGATVGLLLYTARKMKK